MRLLVAACLWLMAVSCCGAAETQKTFSGSEDLTSDAVRLEEQVRKEGAGLATRPLDQVRRDALNALGRGDFSSAQRFFMVIVATNPKDGRSWMNYARATLGTGHDYRTYQTATTAAYLGYQRVSGKTDEAAALAVLGDIYAKREMWRLSLNAYHASLDLADVATVRKTYEDEREKYGFRILQYKVDNDSASPRVCFQFSEPLARGKTDFTPYVAVSGAANGAISTEDQQLCVEGLKHGEHYAIVIRQGLPSAVNETLLHAADYEIYVRDRSPQVHFTGKNYILPRVGQEGIPVVSVNTLKIGLDIVRIGDRNLLPTVRSDDFLSQLSSYQVKRYAEDQGVKVWSGTLDVRSELNKDVTTAFPVQEVIAKLEPGVYLMVAKAADGQPIANDNDDEGGGNKATQWFIVSDLGLTAFSGIDGVHVFARSLATAEPLAGVELRLVARNNEILATKVSDATGHVQFDPGLSRGTGGQSPGILVAVDGKGDYGFLDLVATPFDLTDRGVKGRVPPQSLDVFMATERGVYRSGETVYLTALLRDNKGVAQPGLPLTLVVKRPDGVEYKRSQVADQGQGGRSFALSLVSGVPTGTWHVQAFADPKGQAIGETSFLVEDYVPERLDFTLKPATASVRVGDSAEIAATARYLYGAPGADLDINGEVEISAAEDIGLPNLKGYVAGLQDESFETVRNDLEETETTDANGAAKILVPIPDLAAPRPLQAKIVLRVGETGGRAVERVVTLPIQPKTGLIGVKKKFSMLSDGATAAFDLVAVDANGARAARKAVAWSLYRVSNDYQWYNQDGHWGFERVKSSRRITDGKLDIAKDDPAKLSMPVTLGHYRLDVTSDGGNDAPTSLTFDVGFSGDASADTPDLLDVTLDKASYAAADSMQLRIASRFAGRATVAIVGDKLQSVQTLDLKTGDNTVAIPVGRDWGAGAYAVVLAHRPLDKAANRMPGRALGLAWFSVDTQAHKLDVVMSAPEKVRPRGPLSIPVEIKGLGAGEEAYVTLAAVDVGILNLTHYQTPDPFQYLFGQRQLTAEIRDVYGFLIDGMQGTRGLVRSGGDGSNGLGQGNRPTQEPLARYSGVIKMGDDGKARIAFDLPAFNGTVRLIALAWTKTRAGNASADVIVRDPVVVQATVPRFLAFGDRAQMHVDIDNVEGQAGLYGLDLDLHGAVEASAGDLHRTINLAAGARTSLNVPLTAASIGHSDIGLKISGPGFEAPQTLHLDVEPGTSELYRRSVRTLAPNASLTVSDDIVADMLPGTGAVAVSVSPLAGLDVPALLQALDRYPYGCSEQLVSRAMPLLYVNQIAASLGMAQDAAVDDRIRDTIERVVARQDSNGMYGLWSSSDPDDMWLHAFVTDFLTRAREKNFVVPQKSFDAALERLRNHLANSSDIAAGQAGSLAYAAYVLARNGRPVMGDLRYLADSQLDKFDTPLARAQLAAALAMLGDRGRAGAVFTKASESLDAYSDSKYSRPDYGSRLRDGAGFLALGAEAGVPATMISKAVHVVEDARAVQSYTSTQENSWMVLAAQALGKEAASTALTIDGASHSGTFYRTWRAEALAGKPVKIANVGQASTRITLTTSGHPLVQEGPAQQGYQLERTYYTMSGDKIDPTKIKQNDRFVVALKVTEPEAAYARLLLVDRLPAGLEIDNPDLFDGGSIAGLEWLKSEITPAHTEYRDDRFVAAFNRDGHDKAGFAVGYVVRAVSPGHYVLPPATIEDMYRPQRFGRTAFGRLDVSAAK